MRRHIGRATLVGIILLTSVVQGQEPVVTGFRITIPAGIRPEAVSIYAALLGGAGASPVTTRAGVTEYVVPIGDAHALKLLIYLPGYQMVVAEFADPGLTSTNFQPPLATLPPTRWVARLVDSSNRPVRNQVLDLNYRLFEAMPYFGYADGSVPTIHIGTARTDGFGALAFDIPSFFDDPFFQQYSRDGAKQFQLNSTGRPESLDDTLRPFSFSAQIYERPSVVVKSERGTLSGRLGNGFLRQNGIGGDLTQFVHPGLGGPLSVRLYVAAAEWRIEYNAMLKADGTFDVQLPPGSYELKLYLPESGNPSARTIIVDPDVLIQEGQRLVLELP